jgi:hypothetical protein
MRKCRTKSRNAVVEAGKHFLSIYCLDSGVVLDEIRIDLGRLKKGYSAVA